MASEIYTYTSLKDPVEGVVYKERKSKFIGYAYPIASESHFNAILKSLSKKYTDANHICYAWQLGIEEVRYRVQDDGEPRNSAGMPIYGQIKSLGVTNVAVIVVRYFGGTKLGVGGLISAYREAARTTLLNGVVVKKTVTFALILEFDYKQMSTVMRLLEVVKAEISDRHMGVRARLQVKVPLAKREKLMTALKPLRDIRLEEVKD